MVVLASACTTTQSEDSEPKGPFAKAPSVKAGSVPSAVALADFDGDQKLDLVVANSSDDTLAVLRGDGKGRFSTAATLATGREPFSVAAADFDQDGSVDVVHCNREASTVEVHLNQGNATFAPALSLAADLRPAHVLTRDLNGDGLVDLLVTNADGNSVSVFAGDGAGGFAPRVDFPAGTNPQRATLVDLNGDGALDVVTATRVKPPTVTVLLADGAGGFGPPTKFKASNRPGVIFPIAPLAITSGDVNGDGHGDVIVGNRGVDVLDGEVWLLAGDGSGTLAEPAAIPGVTVLAPAFLDLVDMNGDGNLDVIEADHDPTLATIVSSLGGSGFSVCIALGNGSGSFEHLACPPTGDYPHDVATGDIDGDGKRDFASANAGTNDVTIQLARW